MEQLEDRCLLTTVSGGDTFEFLQTVGGTEDLIRVKARGNVTMELIGAQINRRDNTVRLVNLPGNLNGQPVFGGLGQGTGFLEIGDIVIPNPSGGFFPVNISAIAANASGTLYALNNTFGSIQIVTLAVPPSGAGTVVGTVISTLSGIGQAGAADINPLNGQLAFVTQLGNGLTRLFTVDPTVADPVTPGDEVAATLITPFPGPLLPALPPDATEDAPTIGTISFIAGALVGTLNDEDDSQLVFLNPVNGTLGAPQDFTINGQDANFPPITGLDSDPQGNVIAITSEPPNDDGTQPVQTVISLESAGGGVPSGESFDFGDLTISGVTSLSFLPGVTDPFTGASGAFVGVDMLAPTPRLVFINAIDRNPAQTLYNVYVTSGDRTGEVVIGFLRDISDDPRNPNAILPFGGNAAAFRVPGLDANAAPVGSVANPGGAFIGSITENLQQTDQVNEAGTQFPTQTLPPEVNFGTLPADVTSLAPGLIVERGNDLGKFLLGGTITGEVDIRGNMDLFYAGWVATGAANGQTALPDGSPQFPDNFNVDGDLRDLLTVSPLGSNGRFTDSGAPEVIHGFDLRVGGTLGQVRTFGPASEFRASVEVNHLEQSELSLADVDPFGRSQREYEYHFDPDADDADTFEDFELGADGFTGFYNDTFETAQMLGSIGSEELRRAQVVRVEGDLQNGDPFNDGADYYGVALMAGQTYRARVESTFQFDLDGDGIPDGTIGDGTGFVNLGVFDPDGRLIATDYDNNRRGIGSSGGRLVSFTADRPGIYRFAASAFGNTDFSGVDVTTIADYRITVFGVGEIALGAVVADGNIITRTGSGPTQAGVSVFRGDLGAIYSSGGNITGTTLGLIIGGTEQDVNFESATGNLRSIDAISIGSEDLTAGGALVGSPSVNVPEGSIGHVRARGIGDTYLVGVGAPPADEFRINGPVGNALYFNVGNTRVIGGDVQMIDGSEVTTQVDIIAKGGIGVLKAGDMYGNLPSILTVNADNTGDDGTIDLIECEGAFGGLGQGGPHITTNGGNVRYIRVTRGDVYQDVAFGGSLPQETLHPIGSDAVFTDDSGAVFRLHVLGEVVPNPDFVPGDPNSEVTEFLGSQLRTTTYGIRGSGGVVLINVNVNDVDTGVGEHLGAGLEVVSSGGQSVEIGRIEIEGFGTNVVTGRNRLAGENNPDDVFGPESMPGDNVARPSLTLGTTGFADDVPAEPLDLIIRGTTRVDVLNVVASAPDGSQALGPARFIENTTPDGEIVNITALSIGVLRADGSLGRGRNHTGTDIIGIDTVGVGSDLLTTDEGQRQIFATGGLPVAADTTNAIIAGQGNIGAVRSNRDIGNVFVNGSIGELTANADGQDDPDRFEGIVGVISADSFGTASPNGAGRVLRTRIGEGIADAGTGEFSRAGIFAFYKIGPITGRDADIRGDILVIQAAFEPRIGGTTTGVDPGPDNEGQVGADPDVALADDPEVTGLLNRPAVAIDSITLTNGSLINADVFVATSELDVLELARGVRTLTDTVDPIRTPNFNLGPVTTVGNGGIIGTVFVAADIARITVRDGGFGIFTSDIDLLGDGVFQGIDAAGYGIRDVLIGGGAEVGSLVARGDGTSLSTNAINPRVRFSEQANTDVVLGIIDPFFGFNPNPQTDIHAYLGTNTLDPVTQQPVVTPELGGVTDTGVIEAVDARSSRDLGSVSAYQIRAGGAALNFDPSFVPAEGGEDDTGTTTRVTAINAFTRRRTRFQFANAIGTITTRDVINGLTIVAGSIKTFAPGGDVFALDMGIRGRAKKIDIRGSLGGNSTIFTEGNVGRIDNVKIAGNLIGSISSVKSIRSITIGGDFTGNVTITSGGSALKTLKVGGTFIAGNLNITGNVGTIQTAGSLGSLGDTLNVNGNVNKIAVGGDLRANVRVTGNLKTLDVKGSIVDGGIEEGLVIDVSQSLNTLKVGGDVQPGVKINARAIKKQSIGGQNLGEIVIA